MSGLCECGCGRPTTVTWAKGHYDRALRSKPRASIAERFAQKVERRGECLLWTGATNQHGYGQIREAGRGSRLLLATHVAWLQAGRKLPPGLLLLHTCDEPACVNVLHLYLGTQADNMRDMATKGRSGARLHPESRPRGEAHGNARLTVAAVREIRDALASGAAVRALARSYGVDRNTISGVRDGRTWRHV